MNQPHCKLGQHCPVRCSILARHDTLCSFAQCSPSLNSSSFSRMFFSSASLTTSPLLKLQHPIDRVDLLFSLNFWGFSPLGLGVFFLGLFFISWAAFFPLFWDWVFHPSFFVLVFIYSVIQFRSNVPVSSLYVNMSFWHQM